MSERSDRIYQERQRQGIRKTTTHPKTRRRRERAVSRIADNIADYEEGNVPASFVNDGTVMGPGTIADKLAKAREVLANTEKKL